MSKKWFEENENYENNFEIWYNSLTTKWKHILSYISLNYYLEDYPIYDYEDTRVIASSENNLIMGNKHIKSINLSKILFRIIQTKGSSKFRQECMPECYESIVYFSLPYSYIIFPISHSIEWQTAPELTLENLQPLEIFSDIYDLNLENITILDPDFLFEMTSLKFLNIVNSPIPKFYKIHKLRNLEKLCLNNPFRRVHYDLWIDMHEKLGILKKLPKLQELELKGLWNIDLLKCFDGFNQLTDLSIEHPIDFRELTKITCLPNLKSLKINVKMEINLTEITKEILDSFPKLEHLNVKIKDIEDFNLTQREEFEKILKSNGIRLKKIFSTVDK